MSPRVDSGDKRRRLGTSFVADSGFVSFDPTTFLCDVSFHYRFPDHHCARASRGFLKIFRILPELVNRDQELFLKNDAKVSFTFRILKLCGGAKFLSRTRQ